MNPGVFAVSVIALALAAAACNGSEEDASTLTPESTASTPALTTSSTPTVSDTGTQSATPTATNEDWPIFHSPLGVSFPIPPGLANSESPITVELQNGDEVVASQTVFRSSGDAVVLSLVVTPNPEPLSLEMWINTYPGWPGDAIERDVDGVPALLFEKDQVGDENATIYFVTDAVFALRGNTGTTSGQSGPQPPTLDRADFTQVIEGIAITP